MAAALGADPAHQVVFATMNERPEWKISGVHKVVFSLPELPEQEHHLVRNFQETALKGEAMYKACKDLRRKGFVPDIMVGHSGWGTTMFLRDAFPESALLCYFEWFYRSTGADSDFDPDDPLSEAGHLNVRVRNAPILLDLEACHAGYTPTHWQRSQFPSEFRRKIAVRHDGVDTRYFTPAPGMRLALPTLDLSLHEEIVTYATRGMEPYRGFPQFMRSLPLLLERRPRCHVVIAGDDRICYGKKLPKGQTWKKRMLQELDLDMERVHFTGSLPYKDYKRLLQASSAHVYLTRPFVLSWSLLEAMACGCLVVASDTQPVREVIQDGRNGLLTDFFDPEAIADRVAEALERREDLAPLRRAARRTVQQRFDLRALLPRHLAMLHEVSRRHRPGGPAQTGPLFGPGV
jgi:glycosyltransferase involved in cell wall biosynthesis